MLEKNQQDPRKKENNPSKEKVGKIGQRVKIQDASEKSGNKNGGKEKEKERDKKDPTTLQGNLAILSNKTKLNILDFLSDSQRSMKYSEIMHEIDKREKDAVNLKYHLKDLLEAGMIEGDKDTGYYLSPYGKKIVEILVDFSETVQTRGSPVYIRNSNYEKEEFNENEIIEFLIKEGGFTEKDARLLAKEARTRLFASKVKYLTTPLIREFINGILIEHGLEEKRHALTRLGIPPFDFKQYLIGQNLFEKPDDLHTFAGSLVSEQYLLLNGIPRAISEMIIDGMIYLNNISTYFTKPLSLGLTSKALIRYITRAKSNIELSTMDDVSFYKMVEDQLFAITEFFFGGLIIMDFDQFLFLWDTSVPKPISLLFRIFTDYRFRYKIILNITLNADNNSLNAIQTFFQTFALHGPKMLVELPLTNITLKKSSLDAIVDFVAKGEGKNPLLDFLITSAVDYPIIFSFDNGEEKKDANSIAFHEQTMAKIEKHEMNKGAIVLDKFTINLASLWNRTNDENEFIELLNRCFDKLTYLFELKYAVMKKSRNTYSNWANLVNECFEGKEIFESNELFFERSDFRVICSIGIIGIHETLVLWSGIDVPTSEMYRQTSSKLYSHLNEYLNGLNKKNKFVQFVFSESDYKFEYIKRAKKDFMIHTLEDSDFSGIPLNHPSLYSRYLKSETFLVLDCYSFEKDHRMGFIPGIRLPKTRSRIELKRKVLERIDYAVKKGLAGIFFIPNEEKNYKEGNIIKILYRNAWHYYHEGDLNENLIEYLK